MRRGIMSGGSILRTPSRTWPSKRSASRRPMKSWKSSSLPLCRPIPPFRPRKVDRGDAVRHVDGSLLKSVAPKLEL